MDKRTVLAIVLMGLILIVSSTSWYRRLVGGPERKPPEKQQVIEQANVPQEEVKEKGEITAPAAEGKPVASVSSAHQIEARKLFIHSDLFSGEIDTRGGVITRWDIKPRPEDPEDQKWVELVAVPAPEGALSMVLSTGDEQIDLQDLVFESDVDTLGLSADRPEGVVQMAAETAQGCRLTKTFSFSNTKHDFAVQIAIEGAETLGEVRSYTLWWKPGLQHTEDKQDDDLRSFAAHTMMGDVVEKSAMKGQALEDSSFTGDTKWLAIQTKYFLAAMIPPPGVDGIGAELRGAYQKEDKEKGLKEEKIISGGIIMPLKNGRCDHRWTVYVGPIDYFTLKEFGIGLDQTVYLGRSVLRWIGLLILYFFVNLYRLVPNYGVVIILFSIIVKIVFYPLTRKSMASIRKMQELQPEIKKLQEKYKKDPAKLQKATMDLYRRYKVNPASGCFPMLLQMPVFFALYAVFRNTIELRGASFLWIKDLSAPDTVLQLSKALPIYGDKVNILPIIMAVTMFIQQKMSMRDPKQAYMVYIMPLFLFFIFNNISSGLVLYWTMFNLLQIIQEKIHPHQPTVVISEQEASE